MALAPIKDRTVELVAVWVYPTYTTKGAAKVCIYEDEEMVLTVRQDLCQLSAFDLACYCYLDYAPTIHDALTQADGFEYCLLLTDYITTRTLRSIIGSGWHPCLSLLEREREELPPYPGLV
ncbi:unnamed protein product [marine sediment metagenome]|uniref:Uncharacterized protein n=1 Tax=marine sediment metagenome TaxID=412755 RepID=X1BA98_9ZZZZ